MKTLKQRFAALQAEKPDISQADIARATGAKPPSVNAWFSGETKSMKVKTATAAAALYGVAPLWLSDGVGEKYPTTETKATAPAAPGEQVTPGAMEIAYLYDEIPVSDKIKRTRAWNAATQAILEVLQPAPASVQPDSHQKKQRA